NAQRQQLVIGQSNTRSHRGHASVDGVKAVSAAQEVSRTLGGAADTGELSHIFRLNAHLKHGIDNAFGDGIVAAAGAQGGLAAPVVNHGQSGMVGLWTGTGCRCGCGGGCGHYFASWETMASVTVRASIGNPL